MKALSLPLVLLAGCTADVAPEPSTDPDDVPFTYSELPLTDFVDPLVGTGGPGNTIPGALVPHGMVRASPDTYAEPGVVDAYRYEDTRMDGFSHTHLEGPGASFNGYSQILLLPQSGDLVVDPDARAASFEHATESARPGYYAVTAGGVQVELTATSLAAVHRYTFPAGDARVLIDVGSSLGTSIDGALAFSGSEATGHGEYLVHPLLSALYDSFGDTARTTVYTAITVSVPPTTHGTFQNGEDATEGADAVEGAWSGGWLGWTFGAETTVEVRVGISYISAEQARQNLDADVGDADFDTVAARAEAEWNHVLNRVQVDGTDAQKQQFYTALYRSAFQPADHTEAGGRYAVHASGDAEVLDADGLQFMTDDWCQWDSFRTVHPLGTLFEPELRDDIARSALVVYQQGGWLDKCSWAATGYSRVMIANPTVPILTDMLVKGLDGFDTDEAWAAIDKAGTEEAEGVPYGLCGYASLGTPPEYLELGFVPQACDPAQSASLTLEYAVDDAAAARFAAVTGRDDDAARYTARAEYWRNTFDTSIGYARPRNVDGSWVEPFDADEYSTSSGFCEATSWIYSFHVLHDVPGMVEAMGGHDAFIERLDRFFDEGHFDVSNEPSFHIPWLYAAAGDPSGTQRRVRETLESSFSVTPDGLPGNDDAGATSAWVVLASLGLYQIDPSEPVWTITTPAVSRAELRLHPGYYAGGTFVIETVGDPATQPYIASATLDGAALDRAWITHEEITRGGTLSLTLSDAPTDWGVSGGR
ncbi:MAG: GH92 family glycosyl hydrolase [Pseudomonadota bacterium]|nr:GH92 family glycosyl hydrolase [Pseudomonadota bacterium]